MTPDDILKIVTDIALGAGNILLEGFEKPHEHTTKTGSIDIATEADKAAEEYIVGELLKHFSDHHIVGEEGGGQGAPIEEAEYLWFVDPIDGTTNYANHIPHFCTSIALTDTNRVPQVGVIYNPISDETYSAIRGQGATLNGQAIAVTHKEELIQCVLASGFGYDKARNPNNNAKQWADFLVKTRGVRRFGSAALDFAYVASGRFDGYWERSLNPWDVMAGVLLVEEAGGKVTDYRGGDQPQFDEDGRYIASNGHIHEAMIQVIAESYGW